MLPVLRLCFITRAAGHLVNDCLEGIGNLRSDVRSRQRSDNSYNNYCGEHDVRRREYENANGGDANQLGDELFVQGEPGVEKLRVSKECDRQGSPDSGTQVYGNCPDHIVNLVGRELAEKVRDLSLRLYSEASAFAREKGIIIADTKLEFGLDDDGNVVLIDEVLTPDSSRFWPADEYRVGISPPSYDKQFVRDYLETLDWDKTPPGPRLPAAIIEQTSAKYEEALQRLTAS